MLPLWNKTSPAEAITDVYPFQSRSSSSYSSPSTAFGTKAIADQTQRQYGGGILTAQSYRCIQRLLGYKPPRERFPMIRRAAVCVAVFCGRSGDLQILLSTRSAHLRSYAGDVALPGGKMDAEDDTLVHTARREAFEEIGLPLESDAIHYLTSLPPYHSRGSNLIVTPIVVFVSDPTIKPVLNADEVDSLFAHPLEGFLMNTARESVSNAVDPDVKSGRRPYHLSYDLDVNTPSVYRMHTFESKKGRIIRGFTSDICIAVARAAYGREPEFERKAPGQRPRKWHIIHALRRQEVFKEAARKAATEKRECQRRASKL